MRQLKLSSKINKVNRLRRLSHLLDNAIPIPGTGYSIGIDPILGLVPGGGDTVAGALSAYIVIEAARMGLPPKVLWEMTGNILLDSILGIVPVLGDLFDVVWKANVRNIALVEKHLYIAPRNQKSNLLFLMGLTLILAVIVLGFATLTFVLISWLSTVVN
ncbi:MAG: DUF4112 domain-containing protein [Xenococcaceae cyanobacterium MO_167.B27]|nr:DUF4112 domain-containing protein [Xenococcaceae cyanobacterium MO_167.B27]